MIRLLALTCAAALACCAAILSSAQPAPTSALNAPNNGPRFADPHLHALTNATVHTAPGAVINNATLVIRRGTIESIQEGAQPPAGARVWDCTGLVIYPGFIDAFVEVDAPIPDRTAPGVHWSDRVMPQRSALDGDGLPETAAESLRKLGFTAANILPRQGVFRGQAAVVSLAKPAATSAADRPPIYRPLSGHVIALDTTPIGAAPGVSRRDTTPDNDRWSTYPDSQMGAIALIRQTLYDADWQLRSRAAGQAITPNALDTLASTAPFIMHSDDELEALRVAKIAAEFKRPAIILGTGLEFRRLAAIAAAKVPVIVPLNFPRTPDVSSFSKAEAAELRELMTWEHAPTNPRRLDAAGCTIALTTADLRDRATFTANLRLAIQAGLPQDRALAMLTTIPAEILGVADRIGSIAPGKAANLVIADGSLFDPAASRSSKIRSVWIDGLHHDIFTPPTNLQGTWDLTVTPAPEAQRSLVITKDNAITLHRNDKSVRATNVEILAGRISFMFDHEPLDGNPGIFLAHGAIQPGPDGSPALLAGQIVRPDGSLSTWTAAKRQTPAESKSPTDGSFRVTRHDNTDKDPKDPEQLTIRIDGSSVTLTFTKKQGRPTVIKAENVKVEASTVTFTHALEPLGKDGTSSDTVTIAGDVLTGSSTLTDGSTHTYTAQRRPDDADELARELARLKDIPETLGYPFGPYMRTALPAQDHVILTNATVWTSAQAGIIENGEVEFKDGKLVYVGTSRTRGNTPGLTVIDLAGKHITPGLIDCHSHTGISKGVNESGHAVTAEVRIQDVTNPDAISWYRQLAGGITAVNSLHGSANPIGGQNCINKPRWGAPHPTDYHFDQTASYSNANPFDPAAGAPSRTRPGIKFALGENVKQANWGDRMTTRYPQTRMGVEAIMRDRFIAGREYAAAWKTYIDSGRKGPPPRRDLELEAVAEVVKGSRLIHCHSYRQDEILMLCLLCDEFGIKIGTFQHTLEGYKVAEAVKKSAIGASLFSDWWAFKVEVWDAIPSAGAMLHKIGVNVSFNSDSDELARRMNVEAAKAVKYGSLDRAEALKFVTLNPAIQLGLEARIGSLEPGKDADIAVWSGDPLSTFSRCEATYIDGRRYFSIDEDAAARTAITAERQRLIQKILAARADSRPDRDAPRQAPSRGNDSPAAQPPNIAALPQDARDRLRLHFLDALRRGQPADSAECGDCGMEMLFLTGARERTEHGCHGH